MDYKLHIANGYPIVEIENKLYLIDTGCGYSFSFGGLHSITIDEKEYRVLPHRILSESEMTSSFGMLIDGYIGKDILEQFEGFEINKDKGVAVFHNADSLRLFTLDWRWDYTCMVKFNGELVRAYLDTGAPLVMFKEELPYSSKFLISKWVEGSNYGPIETEKYHALLTLPCWDGAVEAVRIPKRYSSHYPYKLAFGFDQLAKHYYGIDYKNKIIYFN